jgi:hypothetical protein
VDPSVLGVPSSTYSHSEDVAGVVRAVISRYPLKFAFLNGVRIACLVRSSKRSEDEFGVDSSGGGFVRTDRDRGIYDGAYLGVWFRDRHWNQMDADAQSAWVFHQLAHFVARPKGEGIVRVGHDVEAFADEAAIFGAWESQLVLFQRNMDQHYSAGGALEQRAPEDVKAPTSIDSKRSGRKAKNDDPPSPDGPGAVVH